VGRSGPQSLALLYDAFPALQICDGTGRYSQHLSCLTLLGYSPHGLNATSLPLPALVRFAETKSDKPRPTLPRLSPLAKQLRGFHCWSASPWRPSWPFLRLRINP
jgi:hypothetical protein